MVKRSKKAAAVVRREEVLRAPPSEDDFLTNDQAAAFLKISAETLLTWRCRKRGPAYYKIGRFAYYRIPDLRTWREQQRREPAAAG